MKNKIALLAIFLTTINTLAQDITGDWNGLLKEFGLRVVFHISETQEGYRSTLDSPDQGATGIPVTSTLFENDSLRLVAANLGMTYNAAFKNDTFNGTFTQGGMSIPLVLQREAIEKQAQKRPQEPKEPFPYHSEEVTFHNKDAKITLAGTLTLPSMEGKYPAVVLITGSGPQDRNEEISGHKPFLVMADYLTKNGIAVLRYDDRGFGKSTGNFGSATSTDFAKDVKSAVNYLKTRKKIDPSNIGLIGHSEGGLVAPMVASKSSDVKFIVLLAGPGLRGDQILLLQQELIAKAQGSSETEIERSKQLNSKVFELILASDDLDILKKDLTVLLRDALKNDTSGIIPKGMSPEDFIKTQVQQITTPWMVAFMKHDPAQVLQNVNCPVLALNGEKDLQVPPKENLRTIEKALAKGGNKNVVTKEYPSLNHLFQESRTGLPSEYGTIEQTFAPLVLTDISNWILEQVK